MAVDEETKKYLDDRLAQHEATVVSSTTTVKVSLRQAIAIVGGLIVIASGIVGTFHMAMSRIVKVDHDNKKQIVDLDRKWQDRMQETTHRLEISLLRAVDGLKDGSLREFRSEMAEFESRLQVMENKGILPEARRDIDDHEIRIRALEKAKANAN